VGSSEDPRHNDYWRREPDALASGSLDDLAPGFRAVRAYLVQKIHDDGYWLWLEDLGSHDQGPWSAEWYMGAARHLGAFNGAYAAGRPLPEAPWLSLGAELRWSAVAPEAGPGLELLACEDPEIWSGGPATLEAARVLHRFFREQDGFIAALDRLPRVLCHNDAMRANLFADVDPVPRDSTVAIDWALVGLGPLGGELAQLVIGSAIFGDLPASVLAEVEARLFAAYLEGLTDAGWKGDPDVVLFGYATVAVLRWGLLIPLWIDLSRQDGGEAMVESVWHRPAREVIGRLLSMAPTLARLAKQSRRLRSSVDRS
jgi:hypothetical protein